MLLGRPWQYDKKSIHNEFTNTYIIRHEGKLKDLIPLPSHQSMPSPVRNLVHLMSRKIIEKAFKGKNEVCVLSNKEVDQNTGIPTEVKPLLQHCTNVFLDEITKAPKPSLHLIYGRSVIERLRERKSCIWYPLRRTVAIQLCHLS